jgi:hypothetical protein
MTTSSSASAMSPKDEAGVVFAVMFIGPIIAFALILGILEGLDAWVKRFLTDSKSSN